MLDYLILVQVMVQIPTMLLEMPPKYAIKIKIAKIAWQNIQRQMYWFENLLKIFRLLFMNNNILMLQCQACMFEAK